MSENPETCQWGKASRKPCSNPAICTVSAGDGSKTPTCNLHRVVAEKAGWKISDLSEMPPTDADQLDALRESVRRLVGEWRKSGDERIGGDESATYYECANELSALIDGKGEG